MTHEECLSYYRAHKEDYIVEKNVSGFSLKMEYQPRHLLASGGNGYDLHFILTIAPLKEYDDEYKATMFEKISKFEEYKQRVFDINFSMDRLVELSLDEKGITYIPTLFNTENTYGLTKEIKINFVFSPKVSKDDFANAKQLDIAFADEIFETGINHFVFDNQKIKDISPIACLQD
jgi:hypothetical protein